MKRLDRYVAGLYLKGLAISAAACLALFATLDFFEKVDRILDRPLFEALGLATAYYTLHAPLFLHHLLPAVSLMGALAMVAVLSRSAELSTLHSSGISTLRAMRGVFFLAAALVAAAFVNQEWLLPSFSESLIESEEALRRAPEKRDDARFFNPPAAVDREGRIFQIGAYDIAANRMEGVTAVLRRSGSVEIVRAAAADHDAAAGGWRFRDGHIQVLADDVAGVRHAPIGPEGRLVVTDIGPGDILQRRTEAALLSRAQLKDRMREHKGVAALRVQYYHRLSAPLSAAVLVLTGLPVFLWGHGRNLAAGVLLSIAITAAFFFSQMACSVLGSQRLISAQLAAFLPPAAFGALAAWFWSRVRT